MKLKENLVKEGGIREKILVKGSESMDGGGCMKTLVPFNFSEVQWIQLQEIELVLISKTSREYTHTYHHHP